MRHIFSMYMHICNYKKNYVSYYSHSFYVYLYFKICNYKKKNYMNNKTHIFIISSF